ncbi:hypothetical protein ACFLYP_04305 [Chloroflexota bacterium]
MAEKKTPKHRYGCEHFPEAAMEHARAAHSEMRKSFISLLPPEFVEHRRAARREMLLAAREMINHAIERVEEKEA